MIIGLRKWMFGAAIMVLAGAAATPSYWHALSRGDRTGSITVTTTATLGAGSAANLVNGSFVANGSNACWFNAGQSNCIVKYDFGTAFIVNGFRWAQDSVAAHGTWVFEGSNDDSSYTAIGGSFTLGSATSGVNQVAYGFTNSTAYRYYRIRQTGGTTSSGPWLEEIEFRIAAGADAPRDALETGDRTATITASTTASLGGGTINNLVDGAFNADTSDSCWFTNGQSSCIVKHDLGAGVSKALTGFQWLQSNATSHGTWVFEGSNDDSSYTGLGSSFTLGSAYVTAVTFTNTTAYRYYRFRQTSGTTASSPWLMEIDFRVG